MLYESGASDGQIADKLGVATATVNHWRKARGLPANYLPGGKIAGAELKGGDLNDGGTMP